MRKSALCPHDPRAGLIRFQRCLGSRAGSARSTRQTIIRMSGMYAVNPEIASYSGQHDQLLIKRATPESAEPADLLLGHHALDVLCLAPDAVARAPIRF